MLPYHVVAGEALLAEDLEDGQLLQTTLDGEAGVLEVRHHPAAVFTVCCTPCIGVQCWRVAERWLPAGAPC